MLLTVAQQPTSYYTTSIRKDLIKRLIAKVDTNNRSVSFRVTAPDESGWTIELAGHGAPALPSWPCTVSGGLGGPQCLDIALTKTPNFRLV